MKGIELLLLGAGGLAGTFLRFKITQSPLLWGTLPMNVLIVNIVGSFVIGIFAVVSQQWNLDFRYTLLVAVGFCGALTTMSSFVLETSNLFDNRQFAIMAVNVITNVGLSLGSVMGGKVMAASLLAGGWR
ncbi:MAG: CrcB family protein [Thaumarchaeota archaeon]|nr:CrcB family protein [Nitrososphaerota archaeon]